jgi:uncharacterized protein (TIGR02996 family)
MLEYLLRAIVADPQAEDRYLVLADWLEEHDDPRRAELLRLHRKLLATCCEPDLHPERAVWQARVVELVGQGVRSCVPQKTVRLGEGVEMTFNFIPPGSFLMGSPPGPGTGGIPDHDGVLIQAPPPRPGSEPGHEPTLRDLLGAHGPPAELTDGPRHLLTPDVLHCALVGWEPPSREAPPQEPYVRLVTHTARPQRPLKGTSFSEALE